jgi:TM2 domain-containing membrane protein YozV
MFCRNCGAQTDENAQFCVRCGASLVPPDESTAPLGDVLLGDVPPTPPPPPQPPGAAPWTAPPLAGVQPKQKIVAALLGIILGWLGIHRFYLGYNAIGIVQLVLGLAGIFTCGITTFAAWVWGIIDGVMILTGSLRTDAQGVPLRD